MNEYKDCKDITARLKFISRLNKGDKINVKNMFIQQQHSWFDKLSRSFYHVDDRSNTLVLLNETICDSLELFNTYIQIPNDAYSQIQARNLIMDMRSTKKGMINLKDTYSDDVMFVCQIDALIEDTEAKLDEIREKYYSEK